METKAALRNIYRARRKGFSAEERESLSIAINQQVTAYLSKRQELHHIHVFLPIARLYEVNTIPLVEKLLEKGLDLYTSATDFRTQDMATIRLKAPLDMITDEVGIPVPAVREVSNYDNIQMVLIPLLAYDLVGNRLGYGMGFYDRFLQSLPQKVVKAGVSFFPPEKIIPSEIHDIKLDICFTASEVYQF